MKTINGLKAERSALLKRNNEIYALVEKEQRAITEAEIAEVNENVMKRMKLADEISELMAELNEKQPQAKQQQRGVNYVKAIKDALVSNTRSFELGVEERAVTATGGDAAIATEVYNIMDAVRDTMVLTQAGATMLSGLKGNLKLPKLGATTAQWAEENGESTDGGAAITGVSMSPKRLTCYVDLSNKLLEQSSADVNTMIQRDIVNAISDAIQKAVLGNGAGSTTTPKGVFNGVGAAAAIAFKTIVGLETDVESNNSLADGAAYIMHPKAMGLCKTTAKAANTGLGMIADANGMVNGYSVFRTCGVHNDGQGGYGIAFGNWSELFIGTWGNISVTVDPYTQATKGITRLVINAYVDAAIRNEKAFAVALVK